MAVFERIGLSLTNYLSVLPIVMVLFACAIMVTMGHHYAKETGVKTATGLSRTVMIGLWIVTVLSAFSIIFAASPYLYGTFSSFLILLQLAFAGTLFYTANTVHNKSKKAYNKFVIAGILLLLTAVLNGAYTFYIIHKYRQLGGLSGDVSNVMKATAMFVDPAYAAQLNMAGDYFGQNLTPEQQAQQQQDVGILTSAIQGGQGGLQGMFQGGLGALL